MQSFSAKDALPLLKCCLAICLFVYYVTTYATSCHNAKNFLTIYNSPKLKEIIRSATQYRLPCAFNFLQATFIQGLHCNALEKALKNSQASHYWSIGL